VQQSLGCHIPGITCPRPDPSHAGTLEAGVRKRFAAKPPEFDPELMSEFAEFVRDFLERNIEPLASDTDFSFDHWISTTNYPSWRVEELRTAQSDLETFGLLERDCINKLFCKRESYPKYKHARGINSRTDKFKVFSGPYFKQIEQVIYALPEFIKHVPVKDRPDYIYELLYKFGAQYFTTDYSIFEASFVKELMDACEMQLYKHMLKNVPNGASVYNKIEKTLTGENVCQNKYFTAKVKATRMSGEMATSLGNGFTNDMALRFLCHRYGWDPVCIVEGDDGLTRVDGPIPTIEDFAKLGLSVKLEVCKDISAASFCGIVFDVDERKNICDPYKVLANFGWTTYFSMNPRLPKLKMFLRCKALSYAYQYPGCPVVAALAHFGLRVTSGIDIGKFVLSRHINTWQRSLLLRAADSEIPIADVGPRTRLLMERSFKMEWDLQVKTEDYLNSLTSMEPLALPWLTGFYHRDWEDYYLNYVVDFKVADSDVFLPKGPGFMIKIA